MTLEDWREQRANALHYFRGQVDVITDFLARGTYTPAQAVRELRAADAEITRQFAAIDADWDARRTVTSGVAERERAARLAQEREARS